MSDKKITLIAGLGNPGEKYSQTRHNAGFLVIDDLAQTFSIALDKKKFDMVYGKGKIKGHDVILGKPMAFMNRSGPPLQKLAHFYGIRCEDIIILYDDIDLAFERIKIKDKGGHGGHNGLRSIIEAFGNNAFPRLRLGIGRPDSKTDVTGHVLGKFTVEEAEICNRMVDRAGKAVVAVLTDGITVAMNNFNCLR